MRVNTRYINSTRGRFFPPASCRAVKQHHNTRSREQPKLSLETMHTTRNKVINTVKQCHSIKNGETSILLKKKKRKRESKRKNVKCMASKEIYVFLAALWACMQLHIKVQFSLVQDGMRSVKPICAPSRLSEVSPNVAFETVPVYVTLKWRS